MFELVKYLSFTDILPFSFGCAFICASIHEFRRNEKKSFGCVIALAMLVLGVLFCVQETESVYKSASEKKKIETAIENNCPVYVNGIKVDVDTIDLDEYSNIKYDEEKNIVIITTK